MALMEELLLKGYIDENLDDNVSNATADFLVRLLTYCAKADEEISSKERDYIINYIESFDMNDSEETWLFAQYDYGRFHEYNRELIISLRNSIGKLLDKKNLDFKILHHLLTLCLMDNESLNDSQAEIISDFISVFKLNADACDQIYDKVLKEKNQKIEEIKSNTVDDLDEYYKILGLNKNCTKEDLKKQYAYLTKSYHPDKYSTEEIPSQIRKELEDTYKKINLAYDKLRETF